MQKKSKGGEVAQKSVALVTSRRTVGGGCDMHLSGDLVLQPLRKTRLGDGNRVGTEDELGKGMEEEK
jgi:hypothetical protein